MSLAIVVSALASTARAELIILKDGKKVRGKIVGRTKEAIRVRTKLYGVTVTRSYRRAQIKSILKDDEGGGQKRKAVPAEGEPQGESALHVRRAAEAHRAGKYEIAIKAYGVAFARTRDPNLLVAQGHAALDAGEAGMALTIWNRAISEDPGLMAAHEARVKLRTELVGSARGRPQLSTALRSAAEALLRQDPDSALGNFGLGVALTGLGQEDPENRAKGIEKMEEAQELAPGDLDIATSLARVYEITSHIHRRKKETKKAEEYRTKADDVYRHMVKANPESGAAYIAYATFLMERLRVDRGIAAGQGKEFDPAKKAAAMKQIEEKLLEAEKRDPDAPELGMRRAEYWELAGKPNKAVEALETIIAASPEYLDVYRRLGGKHYGARKLDQALDVLRKGLAQKVDRFGYKGERNKRRRFSMLCLACEITLAQARREPKKRDEHLAKAEELFNEAVAEKGARGWLIRQVEGQLREAQGQYRQARRAYQAADDLLPWGGSRRADKIRILLRLARLYLKHLGAPGEAIKVLNSVLERDPANRIGRLLRAEAYLARGKAEEAVGDAKRVLATVRLKGNKTVVRQARLILMQAYSQLSKIEQVKKIQEKLGAETVGDRLRQAMVYQLDKNNDKAAEVYKGILKDDPANNVALSRAIAFFLSIDKRDEAKKLLQAAQAKRPKEGHFKRLALLLLEREFTIALQQKDWSRAEQCWQQALQLDADGAGGRFFKGRIALLRAELQVQEAEDLASKDLAKSKACQAKAQEFYTEAAQQFREGVGMYDKSSKAHYWLGAAEQGLGNLVGARDALITAVELDPTNGAAHRALARMGRTYRNVGNTEHHLKEAIRLAAKDRENLPFDPWLRIEVENQREQQDPRSAIKRREELRKKDPNSVYNLVRLALLYERVEETDKASKCVDDALVAEPKNLPLVSDASRYYRRNGQGEKAEQLLRKFVKQAEGDEKARAQMMVARHYVSRWRQLRGQRSSTKDQILKAQAAADRAHKVAIELPGASPTWYVEIGSFFEETRRRREAIEWLRKGLAAATDKSYEARIRQRVIRLLVASRPVPKDATKEVAEYGKRFPDDPVGLLFRGELFAAQGKLAEAIDESTAYLKLTARQGTGPSRTVRMAEGHFLRGRLYLQRARATYADREELLQSAIRDLAETKAIAPKGFRKSAHCILLAKAHQLMGQSDQAVRELRAVLADNPKAGMAARELVRLYARQKRWEEQEALIRQQMNLFDRGWYWPFALGSQLEAQGKANDAVAPLQQACEILAYRVARAGGVNQPLVLLLRVLSKTKRYNQIIDIVRTKLKPEDRTSDVLTYYAGALAKTGKRAAALAEIRKAVLASGSLDAYSRAVQNMVALLGLQEALRLAGAERGKQGERLAVSELLMSTLLSYDKRSSEALTFASKAAAKAKEPALKSLCLAQQGILLYRQGEKSKAAEAYQAALRIKGDDLAVLNSMAYLLANDLNEFHKALSHAERAAELSPKDPRVLDTLGWCLFLADRIEDAKGVLLKAMVLDPSFLDSHLHLARILAKEGSRKRAAEVLQAALRTAGDNGAPMSKARVLKAMKELGIEK